MRAFTGVIRIKNNVRQDIRKSGGSLGEYLRGVLYRIATPAGCCVVALHVKGCGQERAFVQLPERLCGVLVSMFGSGEATGLALLSDH